MARIKLKFLEECLQQIEGFDEPNIELEQYITTPHIAAQMLFMIESQYGDINGKCVADLGCGTGMLTVGAALLGAGYVQTYLVLLKTKPFGVDVDAQVLEIAQQNIKNVEVEATAYVELIQMDVYQQNAVELRADDRWKDSFDTVIMNPPFGTRHRGADSEFLTFALKIAKSCVYSLHKSSTVQHFVRIARSQNFKCDVIAQLSYNLDKSYKFHRQDSKDISVSLLKFSHINKSEWLSVYGQVVCRQSSESVDDSSKKLADKQLKNKTRHKRR